MIKYLYGASVQGIQDFIFKTNKLAEIVGASELVEQICKEIFWNVSNLKEDSKNILLAAAGNVKCIFESEEACKNMVLLFPKTVMQMAPGITISQAVVKFEDEKPQYNDIDKLEKALKKQRNKASVPFETGFMMLERARRTGGIVHTSVRKRNGENEKVDLATFRKLEAVKQIDRYTSKDDLANEKLFEKFTGKAVKKREVLKSEIPYDIEDINNGIENSWIAVIHADGNGLGNLIQNYGDKLIENQEFKKFSDAIQTATEKACQLAFREIIELEKSKKYPVRPIIIGGDDLTIIIRADLALKFTESYLTHFEETTQDAFKELKTEKVKGGLTACAGIAYVKDHYPLHYALQLAEDLCKDAKNLVKNKVTFRVDGMPKSSVAFLKVMDSFVEPLKEMKKRSMIAQNNVDYFFGPYLLKKEGEFANLKSFKEKLDFLKAEAGTKDKSKGVSKLRQLVSESFKNAGNVQIMKSRMAVINKKLYGDLQLTSELNGGKSALYDLINIHSFEYKKPKNDDY